VHDSVSDGVGPNEPVDRLRLVAADEGELQRRRAGVDDEDVQDAGSLAA